MDDNNGIMGQICGGLICSTFVVLVIIMIVQRIRMNKDEDYKRKVEISDLNMGQLLAKENTALTWGGFLGLIAVVITVSFDLDLSFLGEEFVGEFGLMLFFCSTGLSIALKWVRRFLFEAH